jgi:hypothetical protein
LGFESKKLSSLLFFIIVRRFLAYTLESWQLAYLLFGDLNYHDEKTNVHHNKESSPTSSSADVEVTPEEADDSDFHRELYKHRITLLSEWFSSVNTSKVSEAIANLPVFSSYEVNLKNGLLKEAECRLQKTLYYMMSNNVKLVISSTSSTLLKMLSLGQTSNERINGKSFKRTNPIFSFGFVFNRIRFIFSIWSAI